MYGNWFRLNYEQENFHYKISMENRLLSQIYCYVETQNPKIESSLPGREIWMEIWVLCKKFYPANEDCLLWFLWKRINWHDILEIVRITFVDIMFKYFIKYWDETDIFPKSWPIVGKANIIKVVDGTNNIIVLLDSFRAEAHISGRYSIKDRHTSSVFSQNICSEIKDIP